jgi:hypothetical protein
MNIADVLELALGHPPSMPAHYYREQMDMLAREWMRFDLVRSKQLSGGYVGWFKDHPEAIAPYEAWLKGDAMLPARTWTLREHMLAIGDHWRAAMGLTSGR